jgi:hypothetical protein
MPYSYWPKAKLGTPWWQWWNLSNEN